MNTANSYDLIYIGLLVRLLMNLEKNTSVEKVNDWLNDLDKYLQEADLNVSSSGLNQLNVISKTRKQLKDLPNETEIGQELAATLKHAIGIVEQVIFSESIDKTIYIVPKRRYNGEYLLKTPEKILKTGIFEKLSEIAKFDFIASCRCLAFGEGTASAFHVLRSTEDTLKQLYFKYKKNSRLDKPMWGPMTSELRTKRAPKPKKELLDSLDLIRTNYRNPTQHPEAKYDIDSAQDLFGVCIDLINKMASEL